MDKQEKIMQKLQGGIIPSPRDDRDYSLEKIQQICGVTFCNDEVIPEEYEAPKTEILNQGNVCSCAAHACASALAAGVKKEFQKDIKYSVGYIYANRHLIDSRTEGMVLRLALKQLQKDGDVLYVEFPYNRPYKEIRKMFKKEEDSLAPKAKKHAILNYFRCYSEMEIKKTILATGGVIVSVPTYPNFSKDLHLPPQDMAKRGQHAMLITGWTKDNKWITQNSWGANWGYNGYLYIDMNYPLDECWGIVVNGADIDIEDIKGSSWVRILCACTSFFKTLGRNLKNLILKIKNLFDKRKSC